MLKSPFNNLKRNIELLLKRDNGTCHKCGSNEQLIIWNNVTGDILRSNKDDLRYCFPLCEKCCEVETKAINDHDESMRSMRESCILQSEINKKYDLSR